MRDGFGGSSGSCAGRLSSVPRNEPSGCGIRDVSSLFPCANCHSRVQLDHAEQQKQIELSQAGTSPCEDVIADV
jgi:hypothetical protein